ncbi:MAG: glycoside hydrolase family 97 catalytic domain-containing protein [Actinomycetota bacterium]
MDNAVLRSPDGQLELRLDASEAGRLVWQVDHGGSPVVDPSLLEVTFATATFVDGLEIVEVGAVRTAGYAVDRPSGKQRRADAAANARTVTVANGEGMRMAIDLVAFDDAVAHRFRQLEPLGAGTDASSFVLPLGSTKYVQAYDRVGEFAPASEALYSDAMPIDFSLPALDGWSLPALFDTPGGWMLLGETGVGGEADGSRLVNDRTRVHRLAPPPDEQFDGPDMHAPDAAVVMPWRVAVIGDLGEVVASNAFELLAEPSRIDDTSWIRPGRVSWSWWSESDSPRDPDRLRDFIDFAAEVGWEYSLIDANWNLMPDGTIEELVAYGAERGVGIFLWYNSGGAHNRVTEQPRDRMDDRERRREEFAWLAEVGVAGIKVDFFHSDRASMNRLSLELLEDAADHRLLMNFHGITSPKGWHATWPHLLTTEAVRGAEQYKFDPFFPQTAPRHNTVLPFTRNAVGPMDYTPITVSDVLFPHATTAAHELALGVVFESGLQHPADAPEPYRALGADALDYLRRLPVVWDELRLLSGAPGDHVVFARRHEDAWWIGGINGRERPIEVTIDLDGLNAGADFHLLEDGAGRDDLSARIESRTVAITMGPFGGFVAWPVEGR